MNASPSDAPASPPAARTRSRDARQEVLPDPGDLPEGGEFGHADVPGLEGHEAGGLPRERINPGELGGTEALHVDAVPEEGVPVQVVLGVGDEDLGAPQDHRGVGTPGEVKLGASRRDRLRHGPCAPRRMSETGHRHRSLGATWGVATSPEGGRVGVSAPPPGLQAPHGLRRPDTDCVAHSSSVGTLAEHVLM